MQSRQRLLLIAGVAALVVVVVVVAIVAAGGDGGGKAGSDEIVAMTSANNKVVEAPASSVAEAESGAQDENLANEHPSLADLRASDRAASPDAPRIDGPVPAASPFQPGCLTRSNTTNFSYRNGVRPSLIVLHLTVSPNRPGWDDINGVAIFLNRSATQASSNYIIDNEGHCIYTVGEVYKAWTQANYNSFSACSFEVQNTGNEPTFAGSAGLAKLGLVIRDCAGRWGIPLRRAAVSGGRVLRSGVIDHFHLGAAGGGHTDIHNFGEGCNNRGASSDTWACVDAAIAAATTGGTPISEAARRQCKELNTLRRMARKRTLEEFEQERRVRLKGNLRSHGYRCKVGPPGKRGSLTRV
jgi:hypothetical protein